MPSAPKDEPEHSLHPSQQGLKPSRGPLPKPPTLPRGQTTTGLRSYDSGESSLVTNGNAPLASSRPLPSLVDSDSPHQRPASTPIPPINNTIGHTGSSDGESPVKVHRELPQVPSGSTVNPHYVTRTPAKYMNGTHTHVVPSSNYDLPITNAYKPGDLKHYSQIYPAMKILYFDTRTRAEFDAEHIPATEVVCLEPNILRRDNLSSAAIEDALIVSPSSERALFHNRRKFDLIVMYDQCSMSSTPAMMNLTEAIFTKEYSKALKRPPVLLVGGLDAWKREGGDVNGSQTDTTKRTESENKRQHPTFPPVLNFASPAPASSFSSSSTNSTHDPHERWIPNRPRSNLDSPVDHQPNYSTQTPIVRYSSSPPPEELSRSIRKPAINRSQSSNHIPSMYNHANLYTSQTPAGYSYAPNPGSIQYPSILPGHGSYPSSSITASTSTGAVPTLHFLSTDNGYVSPPPVASINPSPLSRRRNEYVDQVHQVYSGVTQPSINYPDLSAQHVLRPPPAAASSALERQDQRPRSIQHVPPFSLTSSGLINSEYPVPFWAEVDLVKTGLKNLGNTCYMNSTIQCLSATIPFARFFTDGRWKNAVNMLNPLGSKGNMASAFASLLYQLWHGDVNYLAPYEFRKKICLLAPQFAGTEQHDSQEFLSVLLDSLHEDLNRVLKKPNIELTTEREARLEKLPQQIASAEEWKIYRMRNDSIIVDYFQGQFRNRMQCLTCEKTSTTYNTFMYLSLPIPSGRGKPSLYQCLDMLVKEEVLEKSEAWNCPNCKTLRKATKQLSLCRLPPILLIHLKRFSNKGVFTDKVDTVVDFPIKSFDLTNYMPPPLPPAMDPLRGQYRDDPRTQLPPYRYDLYAVTNHIGSLTGGHYTAFVASRGGWLFCEDSSVKSADGRNIISQQAYILFYKRVRT